MVCHGPFATFDSSPFDRVARSSFGKQLVRQTALIELSAFFPAYNEEGNIARTVRSALDILPQYCERFEVIVIDDGSSDRTAQIVQELAEQDSRVRLVRHGRNRGYGAALRTGFAAATHKWVFFTDADGQFDIRDIHRLLAYVDSADLIVGYRLRRQDPFHRRLSAKLWNLLVRGWFGLRVRDVDCAFKLIHRRILDDVRLETDSAFLSTELLCRARTQRARIVEVGVPHYPRTWGKQTGARLTVVVRAFWDLWKLHRELGRTP